MSPRSVPPTASPAAPTARVQGPAAWRGREMAARADDWCIHLGPAHVDELLGALRRVEHLAVADITRDDVELPTLAPILTGLLDELIDGRGFVLLRGVPVDGLDEPALERLFWIVGVHLGVAIPQNDAGDLLVHVRDQGLDFADPEVRAYQTAARLDYHSDSSDVVGLMCVRPARHGGVSTIVSSTTVYGEAVARRPDLADELHAPWWWDRRKPDLSQSFFQRRIFAPGEDGRVTSYYGRAHIESATRGVQVPPLTERQVAALDLIDALANDDELVLNMDFQPGDIQFLNNYRVWHARTEYVDFPEPERKRDLYRLWLRVHVELDLPDDFQVGGITARSAGAAAGAS